ncbi:hypothetical protein MN608_00558 [Microdochium nivale]|nr:hypothetical protein MN608_00558 [Microdochium nivale]
MCYGVTCSACSKKTWRGCGSHIPSALSGVPESSWCECKPRVMVDGKAYPPAAKFEIPGASWISSWFGGGQDKSKSGRDDL